MLFYYIQDVYQKKTSWVKDQLNNRYDPRSKHNQHKREPSKHQWSWGSGGALSPLAEVLGAEPPDKFLGSKEHLDWLKIDLNVAEMIIVQDRKGAKNQCEWKYINTVLKVRVKQVTYD